MATRRTNTLLIWLFGVLAVTSIVVTGVFNHLLAGDPRVLVVTMKQGSGEQARDQLKHDCGSLPGVSVVPDKGKVTVQGRFPVRFKIGDTTPAQEAALESCISKHSNVLGVLTEGDR